MMPHIDVTKSLLPHQSFAVKKLQNLKGGALFMDMGVGKTLTYFTLACLKVNSGKAARVVILAPVSGLSYLQEEISTYTSTIVINSHKNHSAASWADEIILMGIESLSTGVKARKLFPELVKDAALVIDESHLAKNPSAARTQFISTFAPLAKYRYISSGTPMTNGVKDIYTQMRFIHPGILRYHTFSHFAKNHLHKDEWGGYYGQRNLDYITARIHPYTVRFSKKDCLSLPDKRYSFTEIDPYRDMQDVYESTKEYYLERLKNFDNPSALIYCLLTDLQKISCGIIPTFFEGKISELENPKIPALMVHLSQIPVAEHVVVWCKFRYEIDSLIPVIAPSRPVFRLDGTIAPKDRALLITQAKNTPGSVIIATPSTGGHCISLTFIENAVYFSNCFDYTHRIQSEDRIHRLGMCGGSYYFDIGINLGIDKKIRRSLRRKENFLRDFLNEIKNLHYAYKHDPQEGIRIISQKIITEI